MIRTVLVFNRFLILVSQLLCRDKVYDVIQVSLPRVAPAACRLSAPLGCEQTNDVNCCVHIIYAKLMPHKR